MKSKLLRDSHIVLILPLSPDSLKSEQEQATKQQDDRLSYRQQDQRRNRTLCPLQQTPIIAPSGSTAFCVNHRNNITPEFGWTWVSRVEHELLLLAHESGTIMNIVTALQNEQNIAGVTRLAIKDDHEQEDIYVAPPEVEEVAEEQEQRTREKLDDDYSDSDYSDDGAKVTRMVM